MLGRLRILADYVFCPITYLLWLRILFTMLDLHSFGTPRPIKPTRIHRKFCPFVVYVQYPPPWFPQGASSNRIPTVHA